MINETRYSPDRKSEEDKEFFDKYSPTGESEWSRTSTVPFDDEEILIERHYNLGSLEDRNNSQFSRQERGENHTGKGPKGYRRADERIHDDAADALYRCYEVDASEIEVSVKDGVVTLQGKVDSRIAKKAAEIAVESCLGVRDVLNELTIERSKPSRGLIRDAGIS